ncbi:MAG: sigma-70 family RNA polymerase sigma factor [Thermoleophilia bacterium]|nr:sigma-70 family RNA polymerase sigma factor [Thermoleophilia bacterium]
MTPEPTSEQRRQAVCRAVAQAPGLVRHAARFSTSIADAEDAYQRAMEIALQKAPVVEFDRFLAWLRVVIRNEALAISRRRHRETPASDQQLESAGDPVDSSFARLEWRERYLRVHDALGHLTESQRTCVLLQAAGASYESIGEATGFSRRKVERSVLEGRAALTRAESRIDHGDACEGMLVSIDRVAAGLAQRDEVRKLRRHVLHCRCCRTLLRDRRQNPPDLSALVPAILLSGAVDQLATPDPGPFLSWIDRAGSGATFRMGQVVQVVMDVPSSVAAKITAGAAVAAVAGTAGIPLLTGGAATQTSPVGIPLASAVRALETVSASASATIATAQSGTGVGSLTPARPARPPARASVASTQRRASGSRLPPADPPPRVRATTASPPSVSTTQAASSTSVSVAPASAPTPAPAPPVRGPAANRAGAAAISIGP